MRRLPEEPIDCSTEGCATQLTEGILLTALLFCLAYIATGLGRTPGPCPDAEGGPAPAPAVHAPAPGAGRWPEMTLRQPR